MQKTLMRTIRCTYRQWADYMRSVAAECGVPDSYRIVLAYLLRHPGANQKDIAVYRGITMASVSQITKEMQMTGYLRKETDPDDARYVRLYLTEKGETCAQKIHRRIKASDEKITELLTPEREEEMLELLSELSMILKEKLPEAVAAETGAEKLPEAVTAETDEEELPDQPGAADAFAEANPAGAAADSGTAVPTEKGGKEGRPSCGNI